MTICNVFFYVEPNNGHPEDDYLGTVGKIEKLGILGQKHVGHTGRVWEGYDHSCDVIRIGRMDLFGGGAGESMQGGVNRRMALETLAKSDPSANVLPQKIYDPSLLIHSMEVATPVGRQQLHFHTDDNTGFGIIQLWKPIKGKGCYDFDLFKKYLLDASSAALNLQERLKNPKFRISRGEEKRLHNQIKKYQKIGEHFLLVSMNPDSMEKVPRYIRNGPPITL